MRGVREGRGVKKYGKGIIDSFHIFLLSLSFLLIVAGPSRNPSFGESFRSCADFCRDHLLA